MNDRNWILCGLIIFILLVAFPIFYNVASSKPAAAPELELLASAGDKCVRDTAFMQAEHMQLLDQWRHVVVRQGKRVYVNPEGKEFNMSLSNTCLECHSNKAEFCDRCHDYASVKPYCWDCHIDNPKETE